MFIDAHLHTVRFPGLPRNQAGETFATPEQLIEMMDRTDVNKGILLPSASPECMSQMATCEDVLEVCSLYPERFIPFCNLDPRMGDNSPDTDFSVQLNYYKELGCRGLGEITCNLPFVHPLVRNLLEHCERCDMPIIFHIGPQIGGCYGLVDDLGLPGLEKTLADFPKLTVIGHSQPFWSEISGDVTLVNRNGYPQGPVTPGGAIPRLLKAYENLYCGWDAGSGYNALTRDPEFGVQFMEAFADRILFGTDICSPKNDHRHADYLRKVRSQGDISEETFENISWRNANRILKLGFAES